MVIHRNYPMHKVGGGGTLEKIDIVGRLCTSIDRLASVPAGTGRSRRDLQQRRLLRNASPIHFIGHALPSEVLVDCDVLSDLSAPPAARTIGRLASRKLGG